MNASRLHHLLLLIQDEAKDSLADNPRINLPALLGALETARYCLAAAERPERPGPSVSVRAPKPKPKAKPRKPPTNNHQPTTSPTPSLDRALANATSALAAADPL